MGTVFLGLRGKLLLTNKRLIIFRKKGFFKSTYIKTSEIPIKQIIEAYADVSFSGCLMKITHENGKWECRLGVPDSPRQLLYGTLDAKQRSITDRWVNAINRFI